MDGLSGNAAILSTLKAAPATLNYNPNAGLINLPGLNINSVGSSPAGPAAGTKSAGAPAAPDPYLAAAQALLRQTQANQEAVAPTPNFNAINANATARANADVNPIYTKYLNDFLGQQAQQQATQQAVRDQAIQNAQDILKQTQQANTVTGQRSTEDTATKEAQAAQATDWRQTSQGGQFDIDRVAQAIAQAKSGTGGSGVGQGAQLASQNAFNTKESQQATGDAQQQAATELAKARTFEDLATSNTLASGNEAKGEKAAEFNLSSFIQQQGIDLQKEQQTLESQRQAQLATTQQQFVKSGFQQFFNSISNPAQKAAFAKAYGSYL